MAKRGRHSSGGAVGLAVVIVLAAIAYVPKEVWLAGGILALLLWVIKLFAARKQSTTARPTPAGSQNTGAIPLGTPRARPVVPTADTTAVVSSTWAVARSIPSPPSREPAYKSRWIPCGESVDVAGMSIPNGMLYVGLSLPTAQGRQEPALINPNLPVSRQRIDISQRQMQYWPSYSEISPDARRAYLQWLSTGRTDPTADIGYVFLFFYGLERRALVDLESTPGAQEEVQSIATEVRRLLSLYSQSGSFCRYGTTFVNYLTVDELLKDSNDLDNSPEGERRGYELPFKLRVALGTFAAAKKPVPAALALRWALSDPNIVCRTAVVRCKDEFERLFCHRYTDQNGEGLLLPQNKTKLQLTYRPASSAFLGTQFKKSLGDIPDIAAVTGPHKKLQKVVDDCTADLDRYSRFVGRNPTKAGSTEATVLLPTDAWSPSLQAALQRLKTELNSGHITTIYKDLLARLDGIGAAQLPRDRITELASKLEKMGIGIEPDLAAGAKVPADDDPVVLFVVDGRNGSAPANGAYKVASLMLDLASTVASADGEVSDPEIRLLTTLIDSWDKIDEGCRKRLHARLRLQIVRPPSLPSLKSRVDGLSSDSKRTVGLILAQLAHADGAATCQEVKLLERIYKFLHLDVKLLYSDLHLESSTGSTATLSIKGKKGFVLDKERIARLQAETNTISAVLKDVFTEESDTSLSALEDKIDVEKTNTLLGLDTQHSSLLRLLLSRSQWSHRELTDAASDMKLMLDGALAQINEAAFDKLGAPITEGEDPVDVNQDLVEKVVA